MAKGLEEIYRGLNVRDKIQDDIFRETLRIFNQAAAKGIVDSQWSDNVPDEFINQIRTNNAIWSAFRTHRMQNDIAAQLIDSNGQLKPFYKWVEDIKGMTNHYVHQWLQTEYNTAVLRAHQAADWKHFEAEQDVFPNVRWMPTTSPQQDPLHRQYWESKLTLPLNHPFWSEHRPGDRWNCKCSLEQTDEPVNAEVIKDFYPVPQQPGLDNNPGKDGKLFSDSHPYVTKAYAGAKGAVEDILGEELDFVPAETIEDAEKFTEQYIQKVNFGDFKGGVSYKGISLEHANEINRTLQQIFSTVDIPKISGIKPISGSSKTGQKIFSSSDAIAAYSHAYNGIYINTDVLKNAKAFAEYQKKARAAWDKVMANLDKLTPAQREIAERYKKSGRELVDDSVRGCIIHEFGHHIQWKKMPADLVNSLTKIAEHSVKISGYAGTTKGEYIAESFASWMKGEKKIEPKLQEFFDSIAKQSLQEPQGVFEKDQKSKDKRSKVSIINRIVQLPVGDGSNEKLTKVVSDIEDIIRKNKNFETLVVVDKRGNVILDKKGEEREVNLDSTDLKQIKNNIITHNHPRGYAYDEGNPRRIGQSFSPADLRLAYYNDASEIRAVTPFYTFSMKRPLGGWNINDAEFAGIVSQARFEVDVELKKAIKRGTITTDTANAIYFHLVNKKIAKQCGWIYKKARTK